MPISTSAMSHSDCFSTKSPFVSSSMDLIGTMRDVLVSISLSKQAKRVIVVLLWVGLVSSGLPSVSKLRAALMSEPSITRSITSSASSLKVLNNNNSTAVSKQHLKVLVAQYSAGTGTSYDLLLNLTRHINQQYAAKWGYDYECLEGPPAGLVQAVQRSNATHSFAPSRSTYFKVIVLERALLRSSDQQQYDRVLLLDADALVYDFTSNFVVQLLPPTKLLAAHKVVQTDPTGTHNLNIGVTLWNLRHERAAWLVQQWKQACWERMRQGRTDDDQLPLQRILQHDLNQTVRDAWIEGLGSEFAYGHGTVVKHFIRSDKRDWSGSSLELRLQKIQRARTEICTKYQLDC